MKSVMKGDDFGFIGTMAGNGIMPGQFEGRFIGLAAGVGEKYPIGKGGVNQFTRQTQRRLISKNIAGVPESFTLFLQRSHQRGMAMPQSRYGYAAGKIDILFTFLIPHPAALAPHWNKLRWCINRQNDLIECFSGYCVIMCFHKLPLFLPQ